MDAADFLRISDRATVARIIAVLATAGFAYRVPLLQAAHAGRLALAEATRAWRPVAALRALDRARKPALLLLGDDDESPTGPAGWPGAATALRWARAVVLHATGGLPEHYRLAVEMAAHHQRVVMVETTPEHGPAWLALARPSPARPALLIVPPPGDVHPRPAARGTVQ
ncbi:MAG: hypothetical protein BroJett030_25890 [Alphaproteobacteria bacterium]|nr:MAG: hypothetical protein BroJett030_25890 [Alphaproteobacteria bacterium]